MTTKARKDKAKTYLRGCICCGKKTPHRKIVRRVQNLAIETWGKKYKRKLDRCTICRTESVPFGIHCRVCDNTQFRVKYTRHKAPGLTIRVKECKECGESMRTSERPARG